MTDPSSPIESLAPRRAFAVLAPLFGLLYVLATPPFQSPDEPQHFYRAYQISELGFIGRKSADTPEPGAGGVLPRSLKVVADLVMADVPHNIRRYVDPEAVKAALRIPLQPDDREFLEFSTDVLYSPVPYAPQAAAIGLGRLFHAPPLVLLYLARVFNLAAWLLLVAAALRLTPVFRWVFLVLALAPMSIAQAASASADALTNGAAYLLIAAVFEAVFAPGAVLDRARLLRLAALTLAVALSKPVYALLPFLVLLVPAARYEAPKKLRVAAAAIPFLGGAAAAAWSAAVSSLSVPLRSGVSSSGQIHFILAHPGRFLSAIRAMVAAHFGDHVHEFVGQLGWLDVALPAALILLFLVVLALAALADKNEKIEVRWPPRALGLIITAVSAAAIVTAIYIVWNPVGAAGIEGVQGRYFIPFGPLILLLFYNRKIPPLLDRIRILRGVLISFSAWTLLFGLAALLSRFYNVIR